MSTAYLPAEYYSIPMQNMFIAAGLVAPIVKNGFRSMMPYISTDTARMMYQYTDGNPLFFEKKNKMAVVVSPPLPTGKFDFRYLLEYGQFNFPHDFVKKCHDTIAYTQAALGELTKQPYTIEAAKLNLLSSGKATIALFIKFETFCEFPDQFYYEPKDVVNNYKCSMTPKIRIIPDPIISRYMEPYKTMKFDVSLKPMTINDERTKFDTWYIILQGFLESHLRMKMCYIKDAGLHKLEVVAQFNDSVDTNKIVQKQKEFVNYYGQVSDMTHTIQ